MSSNVDEQQPAGSSSKQTSDYSANGPSSKHTDYSNSGSSANNMNSGYMGHQQGGYMSGGTQQSLVDAYMPSYYTPYLQYAAPTHTRGPIAADPSAWSQDPSAMPYMTPGHYAGYGGMYTPFDYAAHPAGYGWFPAGGDYGGDWGTGGDGYYAMGSADGYGSTAAPANGDSGELGDVDVKGIERSMNSMGLEGGRGGESENNGSYSSRAAAGTGSAQSGGAQRKPTSWAGIASQPASQGGKGQGLIPRAPLQPNKGNDFNSWDSRNSRGGGAGGARTGGGRGRSAMVTTGPYRPGGANEGPSMPRSAPNNSEPASVSSSNSKDQQVSEKQVDPSTYNPKEFDLAPKNARFFIIKSYSEDDIHRSIKYGIWCSTEYGNKRLDQAFKEREGKGPLYLLFSVNGSGYFCGMAQMLTPIDYSQKSGVWQQDKWKGVFDVKWIYVKDVPNSQLRHIKLENNEGKPVTNSRDTQEVLGEKGLQVLRIIHQYRHTTSIFDDFSHYEQRQEEDVQKDKNIFASSQQAPSIASNQQAPENGPAD